MSTTANVQNYLVNCFRPRYQFDSDGGIFRTRLELSNLDQIYGNTLTVSNVEAGDILSNLYVGSNAGNPWSNAVLKGCKNVTAVGVSAATLLSNSSNSTFLGALAGAGGSNATAVIAIGVGAGSNTGLSNIYVGNGTGSVGDGNIFIGHNISPGLVSNRLQIATTVYGDLSKKWLGIGTTAPTYSLSTLDVSGYTYIEGALGINASPLSNTLNVNGDARFEDGYGYMLFDSDEATNTIVNISNYATGVAKMTVTGTVQSTSGMFSAQGTTASIANGSSANTTVLQKGNLMFSATDGTSFVSALVFARTPSNAVIMSTQAEGCSLSFSGSNIVLSNSSGAASAFTWSVTYFPMLS